MRHSKIDWESAQKLYNSGLSWKKVAERMGLSLATMYRACSRGVIQSRSLSEATTISRAGTPRPHSEETKQKLSKIAIDRGFGGKNYRKTFEYNGIVLESSYELTLAKDLDANDIRWVRPTRFPWTDENGKLHHYTPDFYLVDYDVYLDPKNSFLIKNDIDKIHRASIQNDIRIIILTKDQLRWDYIAGMV